MGYTTLNRTLSPSETRRRLRFAARRLFQFDATWNPDLLGFNFGVGDTINEFAPPDMGDEIGPLELASCFLSLAEEVA